jgi:hypothetical protein
VTRKNRFFSAWPVLAAAGLALHGMAGQAADTHYREVENWAQFPPGVTKWGSATGVDVDRHNNVYVLHRNETMPIMVFDRNGKFLRSWGQNMFKTTHFLRVDRSGNVWVTDRGAMQAFEFSPQGKLLMTLGKKGVTGGNESKDAFNGMADSHREERRHPDRRWRRPKYARRALHQARQVHPVVGRQRYGPRPVRCAA